MRDDILLVTGATSDVGVCLIKNVVKKYKYIWAHYNSSFDVVERLRETLGDCILPVRADFSDEFETRQMIKTITQSGNIPTHIVHLSALKAFNKQFHKCEWMDYQKQIDTSLRSIVMILEAFLPRMSKNRAGRVVFMLSAYVIGVPPKFQSPYITVKYSLLGLMRNLAAEYAGKGIAINAISPDMMETKFLSELPELVVQQNAKNNPLGRNILVEEVIPTIQYLLSDSCAVITGQNIAITGGVEIAN